MSDPLESLKINQRRQMLAAVYSLRTSSGPGIDLYDLSTDCRSPKLLSPAYSDSDPRASMRGAEGTFSPDGLTYFAINQRSGTIYPIDLTNPGKPAVLAEWSMPFNQQTSGMAVSEDGNRGFFTLYGQGAASRVMETAPHNNGIVIADIGIE